MSQNQSSLLGFLQSRSLFGQNLPRTSSKTKSIKARESPRLQSPNPSIHPVTNMEQSNYSQPWVTALRDSLQRTNQISSSMGSPRMQQNVQQNVSQNFQQNQWTNNNEWNRNQYTNYNEVQNQYKSPQTNSQFAYKNGTASFETAHMQSFRCLDNVSNKISIRLTEVNQKIDRFNHKIRAWITQQLHFAYQSIITILDNAFKQQEIIIRAYVQKIEQQHSAQILKTKNILEAEYRRVDQLKQHLKGPEWRKATGQILTSDLQSKIDAFIRQTYQEDAGEWVPRSYVRQHLKTIEMQVYQLLKLRTFAVV